MRVLYLIGSLETGGAEKQLVQVSNRICSRGGKVEIACLFKLGELEGQLKNVSLVAPAFTIEAGDWTFVKAMKLIVNATFHLRYVLASRPDVLHSFLPFAVIVGGVIGELGRIKVHIGSRRSLNYYKIKKPVSAWIERFVLRRLCKCVFGNSRAVLSQLKEEGVRSENLGLIYNGIELTPPMSFEKRQEIREFHHIDDRCTVFVIVANLIPYKGHEDLIDAFERFNCSFDGKWTLFCLGRDSGILDSLQRRAEQAGISRNIKWMGSVANPEDYLIIADVGLLVSHEEGFSNAILEGMAAGLPIIATDVGGNSEAVIDGVTGLIVPPHSPGSIAEALLKLAGNKDLQKAMGEKGRLRIEEKFTLEYCVDQYMRVYDGLIAGEKLGDICGDDFVPILDSTDT